MSIKENAKPIRRNDFIDVAPIIQKMDGSYTVNSYLAHTIPYSLAFDEINNDSSVVIPANQTARRIMSADQSAMVDIRRLMGVSTSPQYLVNLYDNEYQRYLSNRPIHSKALIGTGFDPYFLPVPLIIHQTQSVIAELTDLSGSDNTVRFSFTGRRYYFNAEKEIFSKAGEATRISRPYFYTTDDDIILPNDSTIQTAYFTIVNDADFFLYGILKYSDGPFLVKISNLGTGIGWQNGWIHSDALFGEAENYVYTEPMLLQRRDKVQISFRNLHTAENNIYLNFSGAHYYFPR